MKRCRLTGAALFAALAIAVLAASASAQVTVISSFEQLDTLVRKNLSGSFRLAGDIDASASRGLNGGRGFQPIGTLDRPFTGTLDGAGYYVSGLYIDRPDEPYIGLFGYVGEGGRVAQLGVKAEAVTGRFAVGAVAGGNAGEISGCVTEGSVRAQRAAAYAGGIAGANNGGTIARCHSAAKIVAANHEGDYAGGIAGIISGGTITVSSFAGSVSGRNCIGGTAGKVFGGRVLESFSVGAVSGSGNDVGGLFGESLGDNAKYSTASAVNNERAQKVSIINTVWDMQRSGQRKSAGGAGAVGKTTDQMKLATTYRGWESILDNSWTIGANDPCPKLRDTPPYTIVLDTGAVDTTTPPGKKPGAAVGAPAAASKTDTSITISAVPPPSNGQTVEYARSTSANAPTTGWQKGLTFTGLTPSTTYNIFARSAENSEYNAGQPSTPLTVATEATGITKELGAPVAAPATVASKGNTSITITAVTAPSNGQTVEYTISTNNTPGTAAMWQAGTTFSGLTRNTTYYVFARSAENATYSAGPASGGLAVTTTNEDVFEIASLEDLRKIGTTGFPLNGKYVMTKDIDAAATRTESFTPIGSSSPYFTGIFDGTGFTISNLFINRTSSYTGLFGQVSDSAEIKNVIIANSRISGGQNCTGALVGAAVSSANVKIANCSLSVVVVSGIGNVGGLIGKNGTATGVGATITGCNLTEVEVNGTGMGVGGLLGESTGGVITGCNVTGKVSSSSGRVGGFAGMNGGRIEGCSFSGNVSSTYSDGQSMVGGFAGWNQGTVVKCNFSGNVVGSGGRVGGFTGQTNTGSITMSYSLGTVRGSNFVGGFVGNNTAPIDMCYSSASVNADNSAGNINVGGFVGMGSSITNCYSTGTVTGESNGGTVGGFAGHASGSISKCYSIGKVISTATTEVGGFAGGSAGGNNAQNYWDTQTSGRETSAGAGGATGLTTANFQPSNLSGFDFTFTWAVPAGGGYPYLIDLGPTKGGSDKPDLPPGAIGIASLEDLKKIGTATGFSLDGHYVMTKDIDASATQTENFTPIGSNDPYFTGIFDGQGFTISNLRINRASSAYVGLFAIIAGKAELKNINIANSSISGGSNTGALVGQAQGGKDVTITGCNLSAVVVSGGGEYVGGLVGRNGNQPGVTITDCNLTGVTVNGTSRFVGGLVGYNGNDGKITKCMVSANVTGTSDWTGGFVGSNSGIIEECGVTGGNVTSTGSVGLGGFVGQNIAKIVKCHFSGSVSSTSNSTSQNSGVGGFVGYQSGDITMSYSTGTVRGYTSVGGFAGRISNYSSTTTLSYSTASVSTTYTGTDDNNLGGFAGYVLGVIENSYSTGAVTGSTGASIGGFVGYDGASSSSNISRCYSTGKVIGTGSNVGGFLGRRYSTIVAQCYWDIETSGRTTSDRGTGLTTAELQSTSLPGFDFMFTWATPTAGGYPYLIDLGPTKYYDSSSQSPAPAAVSRAQPQASAPPRAAVRGRSLQITAPAFSDLQIRLVDLRGRAVAGFRSTGSGTFSLARVPSGVYVLEVRSGGRRVSVGSVVLR